MFLSFVLFKQLLLCRVLAINHFSTHKLNIKYNNHTVGLARYNLLYEYIDIG